MYTQCIMSSRGGVLVMWSSNIVAQELCRNTMRLIPSPESFASLMSFMLQ